MVVDDEPDMCWVLEKGLRGHGFNVVTETSGEEARKRLNKSSFDVALVDLKMPGINGITLLEEIAGTWPQTIGIVITGHASLDSSIEAMRRGVFDYFTKPFDLEPLVSTIRRGLNKRAALLETERLIAQLKRKNTRLQKADKRREEAQEALIQSRRLSAISEIAVSINHEINNPLTIIYGMVQSLMTMNAVDKAVKKKISTIKEQTERIASVTNRLSNIRNDIVTNYVNGMQMIDIQKASPVE
ncbi:MAG: response regulator [Candidatus Latescibacteria bacterium]|nr:response regulator [Candidatus Latescibacterota bacterium]